MQSSIRGVILKRGAILEPAGNPVRPKIPPHPKIPPRRVVCIEQTVFNEINDDRKLLYDIKLGLQQELAQFIENSLRSRKTGDFATEKCEILRSQ